MLKFNAAMIIRRFVWRAGAVVLLSQVGLYLYERLLWEAGGRERRARSSFLSHFQARARSLVHMVAASVRQQIQQVRRGINRVVWEIIESFSGTADNIGPHEGLTGREDGHVDT